MLLPTCCLSFPFSVVWVYAWHRCSELQLALFCICLLERGAGLPWNPCNRFMSKIRLYVLVYWLTLQPIAIPPPAYSAFCLVYSVSAFLPLGISSFCRAWCKDIQLGTLPGRDQIKTCSITSLQHSEYCQEEMMCCDAWSKQEECSSSGCHKIVEMEVTSCPTSLLQQGHL